MFASDKDPPKTCTEKCSFVRAVIVDIALPGAHSQLRVWIFGLRNTPLGEILLKIGNDTVPFGMITY